jgi:hypothetical protein
MAGRGPAPDPFSLRSDARRGEWINLPATGPDEAPPCPLPDPNDREMEVWAELWARPQGHMWLELRLVDEVGMYTRLQCEAELAGGDRLARTLIPRYRESLGLSTAGLARQKWRLTTNQAAPPNVRAPRDPLPRRLRAAGEYQSPRERLRAAEHDNNRPK